VEQSPAYGSTGCIFIKMSKPQKVTMNDILTSTPDITFLMEQERSALELRWNDGLLFRYEDLLLTFVDRHRDAIFDSVARCDDDPAALLAVTKSLIVECGSVHLAAEFKDQLMEIHNELWYCGEKGEHDRAKIKENWASNYAAAWRRWRVCE
jgi:hypothetical protein